MNNNPRRNFYQVSIMLPLLVGTLLLLADVIPDFTVVDIKGVPSTVPMNDSRNRIKRSFARQRMLDQQREVATMHQLDSTRIRLANLESAVRTMREGPGASIDDAALGNRLTACNQRGNTLRVQVATVRDRLATIQKQRPKRMTRKQHLQYRNQLAALQKRMTGLNREITLQQTQLADLQHQRSIAAASQVRVIPLQTLTLAVVTPGRKPVPSLRMKAKIIPKDGQERTIDGLTTDPDGLLTLERLGPPPISVILAVADDLRNEWRVQDVTAASLLLERATGTKIARYNNPQRIASAASYLQVPRERIEVYSDTVRDPLVVERLVVDLAVTAPPGSHVATHAAGNLDIEVPNTGVAAMRLPKAALLNGPVPLRVSRTLPGGEAEAVISSYPHDAYSSNQVNCPDLRLVRLSAVQLVNGLDVLQTRERSVALMGRSRPRVDKLPDGSEWWTYDREGICLQLRHTPFKVGKSDRIIVERIRLNTPNSGSIGGVTPGSLTEDVEKSLGAAEIRADPRVVLSDDTRNPGTVDTYLNRGLRICRFAGKVRWLEIARPTTLLTAGTTAFVPRKAARLYIESFNVDSDERVLFSDIRDLRRYLRRVHSVQLVDSREDADLVLKARVRYRGVKRHIIGILPYHYDATTDLTYSIRDADGHPIKDDATITSSSTADYTQDYTAAATLAATAAALKPGPARDIAIALAAAQTARAAEMTRRAVNRCPTASARTAFNRMVADINRLSDFAVRVLDIDRSNGTVTLNAGTSSGIRVSTPDNPYEFELLIGGNPLPGEDTNRKTEYFSAVVQQADEFTCVCDLRTVRRKVERGFEKLDRTPTPSLAQRIPDPTTGVVSARAWISFPPIEIVRSTSTIHCTAAPFPARHDPTTKIIHATDGRRTLQTIVTASRSGPAPNSQAFAHVMPAAFLRTSSILRRCSTRSNSSPNCSWR